MHGLTTSSFALLRSGRPTNQRKPRHDVDSVNLRLFGYE